MRYYKWYYMYDFFNTTNVFVIVFFPIYKIINQPCMADFYKDSLKFPPLQVRCKAKCSQKLWKCVTIKDLDESGWPQWPQSPAKFGFIFLQKAINLSPKQHACPKIPSILSIDFLLILMNFQIDINKCKISVLPEMISI